MADWWSQPQSSAPPPLPAGQPKSIANAANLNLFTPTRAVPSGPSTSTPMSLPHSSSRARFVTDDLDPADAAAGVKFLPSFASSPAGKLALGTSPGSTSSPPASRRSPTATARFSTSLAESASSPRHLLRARAVPPPADDDMIPTFSLHDPHPSQSATNVSGNNPLPSSSLTGGHPQATMPPALLASSESTAVHIFGPPTHALPSLRPYFESIGPVVAFTPGPEGTNWFTVEFADSLSAAYALRRHGEIVMGRWMLGVKVAGPGSTAGLTLVPGAVSPSNGVFASGGSTIEIGSVAVGQAGHGVGAGTPLHVQSKTIIKPRQALKSAADDYAWEETDRPGSFLGKATEFIFGR